MRRSPAAHRPQPARGLEDLTLEGGAARVSVQKEAAHPLRPNVRDLRQGRFSKYVESTQTQTTYAGGLESTSNRTL